ncbi:MAG: SRPBCC family protein [Actinomycetota bacterium]
MTTVRRSITIAADRSRVWALLAALDAVTAWHPGVVAARCGPDPVGVGSTRTCELRPGASIDEVVSVWRPGHELWFAIGRHGAVRSADMGWVLADHERSTPAAPATEVAAIADYHLAFGPLGPVIDHLSIRRMLTRMLDEALHGLRQHLEGPAPDGGPSFPSTEPTP